VGATAPDFTTEDARRQGNGATLQTRRAEAGRARVRQLHLRAIPRTHRGRDTIAKRYKTDATFVMVYVREAHPTDGWVMESNAKVGVAVKQPTTYDERVKACGLFNAKLKPNFPC